MKSIKWRKQKPDVSELGILSGEHVIAVGSTTSGRTIAATAKALYAGGNQRIRWSQISAADWQPPHLAVVVLDETNVPSDRLRWELAGEPAALAAAVHDRVTASVVITERLEFETGGSALISARKDSDTGDIRWSVLFDAGLDPADPELRSTVTEKLDAMRASLGI